MRKIIVALVLTPLLLVCCGRSLEQKADEYARKGDKRTAYMLYQKAMQSPKQKPSQSLKDKYLSMTVDKARERLENDENLESIDLFGAEFQKYATKETKPEVIAEFIRFSLDWAESVYVKFEDMRVSMSILEDARKFSPNNRALGERERSLKERFGEMSLGRAQEAYSVATKNKDPLEMVGAEYHALCALKYLPKSNSAKSLVKKTRKANLTTYAAYDRAMEDTPTDPEIDKYSIYLAFTEQKRSRKSGLTISGSIYNLSPQPIELHARLFTATDKKSKVHKATRKSKFEKITLDTKMESKFTLRFPTLKSAPGKVVFKEGDRMALKVFP